MIFGKHRHVKGKVSEEENLKNEQEKSRYIEIEVNEGQL